MTTPVRKAIFERKSQSLNRTLWLKRRILFLLLYINFCCIKRNKICETVVIRFIIINQSKIDPIKSISIKYHTVIYINK